MTRVWGDDGSDRLRRRRAAYERTAEQTAAARGLVWGVAIGAAMWTALIVGLLAVP